MDRLEIEKKLWAEGFQRIMGLDEVGRGCLAGPVVAAGVILEPNCEPIQLLRDSKKLSEKDRINLAKEIKEKALFWAVKECSVAEIDELNILWASIRAMNICVESEDASPDYLLVDGNKFSASLIPHQCVVKGDDKSLSIAAASVLAKVYRDELMAKLDVDYPEFGWAKNVGYPTPIHKKAVLEYGITKWHRRSFKLGTEKRYKETKKATK